LSNDSGGKIRHGLEKFHVVAGSIWVGWSIRKGKPSFRLIDEKGPLQRYRARGLSR